MKEGRVYTRRAKVNIDDDGLIERYRCGDGTALEQLIVRYQDRIYNVILKICANRDDAAELTQDAFVKAIENIAGFKGKSSFYTWLFRIAVNLTLNYCKRRFRLDRQSLDAELQGEAGRELKLYLANESSPDPAEAAQNKELCQLAVKALQKLDDPQRAVIVLRDIEDMSYEQIADILNIQLGTVKSRLNRARNNLREIMEMVLK